MDTHGAGHTPSTFSRELSLVGTVSDLPRIAAFVEEAGQAASVDASSMADLQLAVEEACCNVFEHAYRGRSGALQLRFEVRARDVVITVSDRGEPFAPEDIPAVDTSASLDDRPVGGLGVYLMRQLMDEVYYDFGQEGNTLRMVKRDAIPDSTSSEEGDEHSRDG